jgi:GNAT superfamily N-acetyltransferase
MKTLAYEISSLRHEEIYEAAILLHYLWGGHPENNVCYLKWKYFDNPYSEEPHAIVTKHNQKIVGFRGYFLTKWWIAGDKEKQFLVLCACDACVHPDHRRKGLSSAMINYAMNKFKLYNGIFLNSSSNALSQPGNVKLGFVALSEKGMLRKYSLTHLVLKKYLKIKDTSNTSKNSKIIDLKNDRIEFSNQVRPDEMANINLCRRQTENKFKLWQDNRFFSWRYNDPKNRFIFYYLYNQGLMKAYLVIKLVMKENIEAGEILDFDAFDTGDLIKIIKKAEKDKYVDLMTINSEGLNQELKKKLIDFGFRDNTLLEKRDRKKYGFIQYNLVRPIKKTISDADWYCNSLDIRKLENWELKSTYIG